MDEMTVKRTNARRIVVEGTVQGAKGDEPGLVMATEWPNGEGWDISVGDKPSLAVHWSELDMVDMVLRAIQTDSHTVEADLKKMHGID